MKSSEFLEKYCFGEKTIFLFLKVMQKRVQKSTKKITAVLELRGKTGDFDGPQRINFFKCSI